MVSLELQEAKSSFCPSSHPSRSDLGRPTPTAAKLLTSASTRGPSIWSLKQADSGAGLGSLKPAIWILSTSEENAELGRSAGGRRLQVPRLSIIKSVPDPHWTTASVHNQKPSTCHTCLSWAETATVWRQSPRSHVKADRGLGSSPSSRSKSENSKQAP